MAALPGLIAAWREATSREAFAQWRHIARNRCQRLRTLPGTRQGGKEFLRVRVRRTGEELRARSLLYHLPGVHYADAMRHLRHHAQIVRDEQHCHAAVALRIAQQLQHLRLDSHIQCSGGFIGDQQARLPGQRHRDHHALLHTARELKRIFAHTALGICDANLLQQFHAACLCHHTG